MNNDVIRNSFNVITKSVDDEKITKEEAVKLTIRCVLLGLLTEGQK